RLYDLGHQLARFRADSSGRTRIEIYAAVPVAELMEGGDGRLERGLFLFDDRMNPVLASRTTVEPAEGASFRAETDLMPGRYHYSIEARREGPDAIPRPAA